MRSAELLPIITPLKLCRAFSKSADCGECMLLFLDTTRKSNSSAVFMLARLFPRSGLTGISQYWLRYTLQKDWASGQMAKKSNEQSVEEINHADMLIVWISLLKGQANLYNPDPLRIRQTPKETLERDLAVEQDARALHKYVRRYCLEDGDFVTLALFAGLFADEERHIDFVETQLEQHDRGGA